MSEWRDVPVADLCSAIVDCVNKTAPLAESTTPFKMLRTTNVRDGWVDTINVRCVDESTYERWTRRMKPRRGDVILTREAPLGEVGLLRSDDRVFLGQRLVMYRADASVCDNQFLLYSMLGPIVQAQLRSLGSGATVEHLRVPDCERLTIPCPSLAAQRRIGAVLGALDDVIENNRRRISVLEEMTRAIYREWFVRFQFPGHEDAELVDSPLGLIPAGWTVGKLGDLAEEIRESVSPSEATAALRYVPIDEIDRRSVTLKRSRPGEEAASSLRLFNAGDVLFGAMRAYFHKVCIAPFNGVTRSTCFVLRPRADRYHFTVMTLADETTVSYAANHSSGSTIPYAKWAKVLSEMAIALPPDDLAAAFGDIAGPLLSDARILAVQSNRLACVRDLLLPKLVTGQIDVSSLDLDSLIEGAVA